MGISSYIGRHAARAGGLGLAAALLLVLARSGSSGASEPTAPRARVRQPIAMVSAPVDGRERLLVANHAGGSISVIDPASRRVIAEHDVGLRLADLAALPDGRHFLAVDQGGHDLLLLRLGAETLEVRSRVRVGEDPVRVSLARDGRSAVVASRWSRRLTFVDLGESGGPGPSPRAVGTLDLPFFPRELARSSDGTSLVVADAFGGRLALVDPDRHALRRVVHLPGHNLRGLATGPDGNALLVAHQALSPLARTAFDDIHWGTLLGNQLRTLSWAALLHGAQDGTLEGRAIELGDVGRGAADPSALLVDRRGRSVVALAGVNEVAILDRGGGRPRRVGVGRRPVALASRPDGTAVYVADSLDDTVSVVAAAEGRRVATISLGPRPEPGLVERGEQLFHDGRLSHDGWMSCQSCHADGHTSGLLADTLGDGTYGAPKRIPSLLGVGSTGPWNWTGSAARLEDQVRRSIATTMQHGRPAATEAEIAALTAYLRSLAVPPAPAGASRAEASAVTRGRDLFASRRCEACHAAPDYTSPGLFDVGLSDEAGNRRFNPPSLRGVRLREPLLHDGRARTLDEVFVLHGHPGGNPLSPGEVADLVAFLRTL